ncbi:oxidoreductase [Streptomyces sp. NPDC005562]|uniref:oxidoreductase n=1 Tax=Streptomyces sp. NPDC005562 TaxID=3154890 RepID=UPI00339EC73C
MSDSKTFLITGVSTGLGRALGRAALAEGHRVVGTVRTPEDARSFEALTGDAHARILDVTDHDAVDKVVEEAERDLGPLDVIVANAGYGHDGLFEESSMDDLRRQFEVNVYGTVAVIKAVLPHLRERRAGHIIAVTSMGGLITMPGLSFYHGSKFAVEGILETLGKEVAGFGIHVTAVEPGSFRTDWSGRSMIRAPRSIADYDELFEPLRHRRIHGGGTQPGDPDKAAEAVLRMVAAEQPPKRLLLGNDALRLVRAGREDFEREMREWAEVSASTDFDDVARSSA